MALCPCIRSEACLLEPWVGKSSDSERGSTLQQQIGTFFMRNMLHLLLLLFPEDLSQELGGTT